MREYEFDYTISQSNNPKIFKDTCYKIEKAFPAYEKDELLVDADGSTI